MCVCVYVCVCVCVCVEKIKGRKIYTMVWMEILSLPTRVSTKILPI